MLEGLATAVPSVAASAEAAIAVRNAKSVGLLSVAEGILYSPPLMARAAKTSFMRCII